MSQPFTNESNIFYQLLNHTPDTYTPTLTLLRNDSCWCQCQATKGSSRQI